MGFFTVSTSEDQIKDGGNGNYIFESGIYEILIKNVIYNKSQNGSESLDLNFDYNGQNQTIFNAIRLTNNDGSPNFQRSLFNKLCIVIGADDGTVIDDPVKVQLPIGKGGAIKDCMVLEQFQEIPVFVRVQMEYQLYEGKIRENKNVKNFFRYEDKATAQEIVNNENIGNQYQEEEKFADKVTYKNGLTKEDVEVWKKERLKNNNTSENNADNNTNKPPLKRHSFGKVV